MGDDHNGAPIAMELFEQGQDLIAGLAIERTGWLVRQDQGRIVDECAGNRDPLLLAPK